VINGVPRCRLPRAHSPDSEHRAARHAPPSTEGSRGVARHDLGPTPFDAAVMSNRLRYARAVRRLAYRGTRAMPRRAWARAVSHVTLNAVVPPRRRSRRLGAPARAGRRPSTRAVRYRTCAGASAHRHYRGRRRSVRCSPLHGARARPNAPGRGLSAIQRATIGSSLQASLQMLLLASQPFTVGMGAAVIMPMPRSHCSGPFWTPSPQWGPKWQRGVQPP